MGSRGPLEAVLAMGFNEKDAAIALYRTWDDPDAAVALLLGENGAPQDVPDSEEEDLARAMALSLGDDAEGGDRTGGAADQQTTLHGGFRYGEDYPKPIIQPVSLVNTEEAEEEARREQAKRDEQIIAS